ncbi:MAG: hypothetical protein GYB66_05455 [Chloroflexi bacterium]|nr:hypothetical protein [Chloroflexota bacterium]
MTVHLPQPEYRDAPRPRHWSRQSQPIAPAEILVDRLQNGWILGKVVKCQRYEYGPGRSVNIYHFTLTSNGETTQIPVHSNPVVRRLIHENNLQIVPLD